MARADLEKEAEEKGREWERSVLPEREEDYVPYAPYYPYSKGYIAGYEARNEEVKTLKEKVHWWKKEVNVAHKAREDEFEKLVIENKVLKEEKEKLQLLLDVQNFLIEPKNKEKKEHLQQNGWVEITMPCSKEDARDCLTKQEGLCESTDGLCRIKINLSRLCRC